MKNLQELFAYYTLIDSYLDDLWSALKSEPNRQTQIERRQHINDQAYFVLCWGQIESELDESCRNAIRKRRNDPNWTKRRGWDLYDPEQRKLSGLTFEERVALVLDKQGAGGEWGKVICWYGVRNRIAHGGSHEQRIDLNVVVGEFYQIQSAIAP